VYKWAYADSVIQKNQICLALFDRRSGLIELWEKLKALNISVMVIFTKLFWYKFSHTEFTIYVTRNTAISSSLRHFFYSKQSREVLSHLFVYFLNLITTKLIKAALFWGFLLHEKENIETRMWASSLYPFTVFKSC